MTAINVKTIRRQQRVRRLQQRIARTVTTIGQTFDRDYQQIRTITDMDKRAATHRAFSEVRALERDYDVVESQIVDAAKRLALGLGDEEKLLAELDELDAEMAQLRRRGKYWTIAAKTLEDERGLIRDSAGNLLS
jgi:hypothetical protein